jgi:hypothetical protein
MIASVLSAMSFAVLLQKSKFRKPKTRKNLNFKLIRNINPSRQYQGKSLRMITANRQRKENMENIKTLISVSQILKTNIPVITKNKAIFDSKIICEV